MAWLCITEIWLIFSVCMNLNNRDLIYESDCKYEITSILIKQDVRWICLLDKNNSLEQSKVDMRQVLKKRVVSISRQTMLKNFNFTKILQERATFFTS